MTSLQEVEKSKSRTKSNISSKIDQFVLPCVSYYPILCLIPSRIENRESGIAERGVELESRTAFSFDDQLGGVTTHTLVPMINLGESNTYSYKTIIGHGIPRTSPAKINLVSIRK